MIPARRDRGGLRGYSVRITRILPKAMLLTGALVLLLGCEMILGQGETPNVSLDLGQFLFAGRAVAPPAGITFTRIDVTVYSPGMTTITKSVSPGARYLNIYVPAGPDRRFKVEAFFTVTDPQAYQTDHLRSYIGRARADLLPGRYQRLVFNMAAGASIYFVPDYTNGVIYLSDDLQTFSSDWITVLGAGTGIGPMDVEISARGYIYAANYTAGANVINYAENRYGTNSGTIPTSDRVLALAMDRHAGFDIDGNNAVDTSILYYSTASNGLYFTVVDSGWTEPQPFNLEGRITTIYGLAVDPWTHRLLIAGVADGAPALVSYDPFFSSVDANGGIVHGRIVSVKTDSRFRYVFDVTATDEAIFALNLNLTLDQVPSLFKFDENLNVTAVFGGLSHDATAVVPSTAAGQFYFPIRFIAPENPGLTIIDDSNVMDATGKADYDKLIRINPNLDAGSWQTYPPVQPTAGGTSGESFRFLF
jgi:hypothetical protein